MVYPFGEPRDWDRLLKYAEASRTQALVVTSGGVTRVVEEDMWLAGVDAAVHIARSTESLICVVVANRPILDAMQAEQLDLSSPANAVSKLASKLAERGGLARAAFAFPPSAELVPALNILDSNGRPFLRISRVHGTEPYVAVRVRYRWLTRGRRRFGQS